MKVTTKKTHSYAAKLRRPGDSYEATGPHAAFLKSQGFVEYAKDEKPAAPVVAKAATVQTAAFTAESKTPETEKPKREYKRRDLTAEDEAGKA